MRSDEYSVSRTKKLTAAEARPKIQHYCAYQERSHHEVRNKLYTFGLYRNEIEEILSGLITDGFLNEERFARAFVGGKFRMKKWGRLKITRELETHGLTKNCIKAGLSEIDESDYQRTLHELLSKKSLLLYNETKFIKRDKLAKYGIQKGYEPEVVWRLIKEFF